MRGGGYHAVPSSSFRASSVSSWPAPPSSRCAPTSHRVPDVRCVKPYIGAGRMAFPCGSCLSCRLNRRRIWTHRIMLEAMQHAGSCFATLTYAPEFDRGTLQPGDLKNWLKRLRKSVYPQRVRYYAVGEYGDRSWRPHYHAALFGIAPCFGGPYKTVNKGRICLCRTCSVVRETWTFGHTMVGTLEERSAQYIAGYVTKKLTNRSDPRLLGRYPEFARMSLKPGIGADAVPDVASVMMQYSLEKRGDVPISLRHGSREMPLGRYLRKLLRVQVGLDEKAPPEYLEALRQGLLPVWDYADALWSQPGMARQRRETVKQVMEELNKQQSLNSAARDVIHNKRRL